MTTTVWIFHAVKNHVISVAVEQPRVFVRIQARVVEHIPKEIAAYLFSLARSTGNDEHASRHRVLAKRREHLPLVVRLQMEEAVPRDHDLEAPRKIQVAHIGLTPRHLWKSIPAHIEHLADRVDAGDAIAIVDEVASEWLSASASKIENVARGRCQSRCRLEIR